MNGPVGGVDLGGTNIKVGLVNAEGEVRARHSLPTRAERGPEAVAERIGRGVQECLRKIGLDLDDLEGLGVGSPGTINLQEGVVEFSPNLPGWENVPLRRLIAAHLGLRPVLDNDANVAALAEHWVGAGRAVSSLVLLTLGTGIGGGIVLNDRIWHGGGGVAGEIGHMSINPDGPECGCRNHGCIEVYASATAMVRRLRERVEQGAPTTLADRMEELTAEAIHRAAVAGDETARKNVEQTGRYLGVAVSNIMHMLNPEVIAFSGGMTAAGDMLMSPLREEARARTMAANQRGVTICYSEVPDDAGIIGAARCAMLA